jgi:hypothetical protein
MINIGIIMQARVEGSGHCAFAGAILVFSQDAANNSSCGHMHAKSSQYEVCEKKKEGK